MKRLQVLVLFVSLTVPIAVVSAGEKRKSASPGFQKSSPTTISSGQKRPFDLEMLEDGHVEPRFEGVSVGAVVAALEKKTQLKKGEFESSSEFALRKEKALDGNLLGSISINDPIAFALPVPKLGILGCGLRYEYNPDKAEAKLFAAISNNEFNGIGAADWRYGDGRELDNLTLAIDFGKSNTYDATNAYGAHVTVKEISAKRFGIVMSGGILGTSSSRSCSSSGPIVRLQMPTEIAAKELPSLKALVITKLTPPYLAYHFDHTKPTRDDPTELHINSVYLYGDVLAVVFYSGVNGKILARFPDAVQKQATEAFESH